MAEHDDAPGGEPKGASSDTGTDSAPDESAIAKEPPISVVDFVADGDGDSADGDGDSADGDGDSADGDGDSADGDAAEDEVKSRRLQWLTPIRAAMLVGLAILVVAAGLVGYLGFRAHQSQQTADRNNLYLQVARQGAVNLTTIDWQEADADIQRILDSATGTFYDEFSQRSQPFVAVVKQAQSKSVGTVTEAGLATESDDQAQVLVAVSVKTTNLGAAEQQPRAWRMRIDVQRVGDEAKVSNVQFVP